jgi:hypothetical protein
MKDHLPDAHSQDLLGIQRVRLLALTVLLMADRGISGACLAIHSVEGRWPGPPGPSWGPMALAGEPTTLVVARFRLQR